VQVKATRVCALMFGESDKQMNAKALAKPVQVPAILATLPFVVVNSP
tara:strand:+ start:2781 stop:2921 length:141 start_codon:yes stop_codon:yes gene_type:complete